MENGSLSKYRKRQKKRTYLKYQAPEFRQNKAILKSLNKNSFIEEIQKNKGWGLFMHRLIRSHDAFDERDMTHLKNVNRQLVKVMKYLKVPSQKFVEKSLFCLKENKQTKNKFLFIQFFGVLVNEDYIIQDEVVHNLVIRNWALQFILQLSKVYDLYIYTEKQIKQTQIIKDKLQQSGLVFVDWICKENCFITQKKKIIKDLRTILNKNIRDMVIVDTSVYSFGINLLNGVPIIPFNKSTHNDDELKMLIPLLKEAAKKNDVRDFLKDEIKLIEIAEEALEYKQKMNQ